MFSFAIGRVQVRLEKELLETVGHYLAVIRKLGYRNFDEEEKLWVSWKWFLEFSLLLGHLDTPSPR